MVEALVEQGRAGTSGRNLVQGILDECNRCRALAKQYEAIGPVGVFGLAMIEYDIREAEAALGSGDVERMILAFKTLQGCS